jgi:pyruvate formate lyase activating enzyme
MRIGGILDMSTIDWYGNVSLVVFFAGCNFRCPFCQNSSLLPLDSGQEVDADYIKQRIEVGRSLLDSVVISGGEPLLQADGIKKVAGIARELGLKLCLNTNGSVPSVMQSLLETGLIDRVALDIKAPFTQEDYSKVIGVNRKEAYRNVEKTLDICNSNEVEIEVRTTVAPGISDDPDFIKKIASALEGRYDTFHLQQFDNLGDVLDPEFKFKPPPSRETMQKLAHVALAAGLKNVYIKTRKNGLERIG